MQQRATGQIWTWATAVRTQPSTWGMHSKLTAPLLPPFQYLTQKVASRVILKLHYNACSIYSMVLIYLSNHCGEKDNWQHRPNNIIRLIISQYLNRQKLNCKTQHLPLGSYQWCCAFTLCCSAATRQYDFLISLSYCCHVSLWLVQLWDQWCDWLRVYIQSVYPLYAGHYACSINIGPIVLLVAVNSRANTSEGSTFI